MTLNDTQSSHAVAGKNNSQLRNVRLMLIFLIYLLCTVRCCVSSTVYDDDDDDDDDDGVLTAMDRRLFILGTKRSRGCTRVNRTAFKYLATRFWHRKQVSDNAAVSLVILKFLFRPKVLELVLVLQLAQVARKAARTT